MAQASSGVPSQHGHTLISNAQLRQLYELTLRLRLGIEQAQDRSLAGREAALAAVSCDLRPGDALVTGHLIPTAIHLTETATPLAERIIGAIGRAAADRLRRNGRVTAIFSSGAPEDLLHEAYALARAAKLPVIFVEEASAAPKKPHAMPDARLLTSIPVDAQDVVALFRVAHESVARAREGWGPTRILCTPWPSRNGEAQDAVAHLERWLEARGLPAQEWRQQILAEAEAASSASREQVLTEVL